MANEIASGELIGAAVHHGYHALICGGTIGGLLCWLLLFTFVSLLHAAFCMRRNLIIEPAGIFNPIGVVTAVITAEEAGAEKDPNGGRLRAQTHKPAP